MKKKTLITAMIIILTTLLAFVLDEIGLYVENILMLYAVAVLIIITETKSFRWGVASTIICIFTFNFLFTQPRYSFMMTDPNNIVSLFIFLVVSFIVSTLVTRLNNQILFSNKNEERTAKLYKISSGYLNITGFDNIIVYGENSLSSLIDKPCKLYIKTDGAEFEDSAVAWSYKNAMPCGFGEGYLDKSKDKYIPVKSGNKTLGVLQIELSGVDISKEETLYINTMLNQITIALEHDYLSRAEEINRLNIEKEKLKSSLLRSISHDLRTPLTTIGGNAEFLLDNESTLDEETKTAMLADIVADSTWLSSMVENLLNMTKIQDGRLILRKQNEVVDDIIGGAVSRISKRLGRHKLTVNKPDEVLLVPMDGQLIIQVLVNLIDNCIKHTREDSQIVVSAVLDEQMYFEVSDNGGGIKADVLLKIFDSFVTSDAASSDNHRGIGLGLSIVKSIVEAHGGEITAENNDKGGATFRFTLSMKAI